MRSLNKNEFIEKVEIRPENILEGFNNYNNAIITTDKVGNEQIEKDFINFFVDIFMKSKGNIVDYYGNILNSDEFNRMISTLENNEKNELIKFRDVSNNNHIYFEIDSIELLIILIKLSVRGILFSTFYMVKDNVTIWSNYDYKFVIFFKQKGIITDYLNIAKKYNLLIKDIKCEN